MCIPAPLASPPHLREPTRTSVSLPPFPGLWTEGLQRLFPTDALELGRVWSPQGHQSWAGVWEPGEF